MPPPRPHYSAVPVVDFENYEGKRMERNGWRVAQDIALQINDASRLL